MSFDLPAFLKEGKIDYELYRDSMGCIGKWDIYTYSWDAMVTEQGSAYFITKNMYDWGRYYILGIEFKGETLPLIGGKHITYISIDDYPEDFNVTRVRKAIENFFINPVKMSWKEFGEYIDELEFPRCKHYIRVQYETNEGVDWTVGERYFSRVVFSKELIPWDDAGVR